MGEVASLRDLVEKCFGKESVKPYEDDDTEVNKADAILGVLQRKNIRTNVQPSQVLAYVTRSGTGSNIDWDILVEDMGNNKHRASYIVPFGENKGRRQYALTDFPCNQVTEVKRTNNKKRKTYYRLYSRQMYARHAASFDVLVMWAWGVSLGADGMSSSDSDEKMEDADVGVDLSSPPAQHSTRISSAAAGTVADAEGLPAQRAQTLSGDDGSDAKEAEEEEEEGRDVVDVETSEGVAGGNADQAADGGQRAGTGGRRKRGGVKYSDTPASHSSADGSGGSYNGDADDDDDDDLFPVPGNSDDEETAQDVPTDDVPPLELGGQNQSMEDATPPTTNRSEKSARSDMSALSNMSILSESIADIEGKSKARNTPRNTPGRKQYRQQKATKVADGLSIKRAKDVYDDDNNSDGGVGNTQVQPTRRLWSVNSGSDYVGRSVVCKGADGLLRCGEITSFGDVEQERVYIANLIGGHGEAKINSIELLEAIDRHEKYGDRLGQEVVERFYGGDGMCYLGHVVAYDEEKKEWHASFIPFSTIFVDDDELADAIDQVTSLRGSELKENPDGYFLSATLKRDGKNAVIEGHWRYRGEELDYRYTLSFRRELASSTESIVENGVFAGNCAVPSLNASTDDQVINESWIFIPSEVEFGRCSVSGGGSNSVGPFVVRGYATEIGNDVFELELIKEYIYEEEPLLESDDEDESEAEDDDLLLFGYKVGVASICKSKKGKWMSQANYRKSKLNFGSYPRKDQAIKAARIGRKAFCRLGAEYASAEEVLENIGAIRQAMKAECYKANNMAQRGARPTSISAGFSADVVTRMNKLKEEIESQPDAHKDAVTNLLDSLRSDQDDVMIRLGFGGVRNWPFMAGGGFGTKSLSDIKVVFGGTYASCANGDDTEVLRNGHGPNTSFIFSIQQAMSVLAPLLGCSDDNAAAKSVDEAMRKHCCVLDQQSVSLPANATSGARKDDYYLLMEETFWVAAMRIAKCIDAMPNLELLVAMGQSSVYLYTL